MRYSVHSSNLAFTGDIVGIDFTAGVGTVDTEAEGGYAAYSYFERAGYSLVPVEDTAAAPVQGPEGSGEFDPSQFPIPAVLAHLADATPEEAARVLAAEVAGQNRKGIVGTPADTAETGAASPADQSGVSA